MACARCAHQPRQYCRDCERQRQAELLYDAYEYGRARALYRGDVARLPFARLPAADKAGWIEVAAAHREMAR